MSFVRSRWSDRLTVSRVYTHLLLVLPILVPLATAVLVLLLRKTILAQRAVSVVGTAAHLGVSIWLLSEVIRNGVQATSLGNWPMPFGITLVADHLSAIMLVISTIISFTVVLYSVADIDRERMKFGFHPFFQVLMVGVCGSFLTADLFNLYVWFEVMLIASFSLIVLGNEKDQLKGGIKYVALNLVSSMFFLAGVGLLYGLTGTLNMAEMALALGEVNNPGLVTTIAMFFVIAFGVKAAVFPLFFWLPDSYHTPPVAVSAIFAGLLTKVGVYALIRVFTLLFVQDVAYTHQLLLWIAGLTMVTGVLGAASQMEFRKVLSFHIISQIGYMIMGLALYTPLALVGAVFYIVHHIIVKTNLFLVAGVARHYGGTMDLDRLGDLYRHRPYLSMLFLIPAFSLAGFPPLSGFWAKVILVKAGFDAGAYVIVAVALVVGLLTLYSMSKIWMYAFLKKQPESELVRVATSPLPSAFLIIPIIILAMITLTISFFAFPFFNVAEVAALELMNPSVYINAVMGS
jgi:multicomponent Na+:H+ antiporter subunit D